MQKELLKEVIVSQKRVFLEKRDLFLREIIDGFYEKFHKIKEVLIITGIRRCGKSFLLRLIWEEYKKRENVNDDQFIYINFEDERLASFEIGDFSKILEAYQEIYLPDDKKKIFLFLDEIQNVTFWEKWINRLYEENRFKIFITGSNATLLSSELSTSLTGRNIPLTLYPLSFYEFLAYYKQISIGRESYYDQKLRIKIEKCLDEYITYGGMPEFTKTHSIELIQEYFKDIISRDIVNRYRIKYKQGLKELAHLLLSNLGQVQSLKRISAGIEIKNINTIKNYLCYMEDSFLFRHLPLFSYSYKIQLYNPDKYYPIDIAFFNNIAFKNSDNSGAVYETIVFGELIRNAQNEIFYYRTANGYEVDFVVKSKNKALQLIQVCCKLTGAKTVEREERALLAAMNELKLKEGTIINREMDKVEKKEGRIFRYIPLWKWLLQSHYNSSFTSIR